MGRGKGEKEKSVVWVFVLGVWNIGERLLEYRFELGRIFESC